MHCFKLAVTVGLNVLIAFPTSRADEQINFVRDVRPIFIKHCYSCHSETKQESGFRLDVKKLAVQGGDNHGPDIVPGQPDKSPLIQFISADLDDDKLMPPGEKLAADEIAVLTRWVKAGAVWPDGVDLVKLPDRTDHWSFKQPVCVSEKNSIDEFVHARLRENNLQMSTEVAPVHWLRRVTFDLTGLPPTPDEVAVFREAVSTKATETDRLLVYRRVVDRLLASPHYGERQAQHWLDIVRYADTHGFEVNTERKHAWPYRDYVIAAFNRDLDYDQFIREQIAGDAFGADVATGFLVTASVLLPGQIGKDEPSKRLARQDSLDEIVNNIGQTFLGLSIGCARCHDHKFDPITAQDYYSMQAFVAGVEYADRAVPQPTTTARVQEIALVRQHLSRLDEQLKRIAKTNNQPFKLRKTNPQENIETFAPASAKYVRLTIHDANHHPTLGLIEPCLDEVEIFTSEPEPRNVALASAGTRVIASGSRESSAHRLGHINDGKYGNASSWMSATKGRGWVQFELPEVTTISEVKWSRDRLGQYQDRLPTLYTLEVGLTEKTLEVVAGVSAAELPLYLAKQKLVVRQESLEERKPVFAGAFRKPDRIHLLKRGDPEQPGAEVSPAVPIALGQLALSNRLPEQQRRIALANWIASPRNPLTARVMVNRIWQTHFGKGLVSTPSDFGRNGSKPTHPELLDWLAIEFVRSGWKMKALHRRIVLSQTYRQDSQWNQQRAARDTDNRWLWRYPLRRLQAESLRDSMLAISGLLNCSMHGPGFNLFDKRGGLSGFKPVEALTSNNRKRMIYAHKIRRETDAVFGAFDCPDGGQSTAVRRESTTPIQALNLMNSSFSLSVSNAFADRIRNRVGENLTLQIEEAYLLALHRQPTPAELSDAKPVVRDFGLQTLCRALLNSNEFLFVR